jgi:hypothetical protein
MKIKGIVVSVLLCFSCLMIDAQNFLGTYYGFYDDGEIRGYSIVTFSNRSISIDMEEDWYTGKAQKKNETYTEINRAPLRFLKTKTNTWLVVLWPEGVFLSDSNMGTNFFLSKNSGMRTVVLDDSWVIYSSSFLKERNAQYGPGNMMDVAGLPWASGNGYGIGDKLTINLADRVLPILLLNGFISENRPELYYENSRIKQARLTDTKNGRSKIIDVEDEPCFQRFQISDIAEGIGIDDQIILEVLDVYKGTKYKDLCIKSIIPDFSVAK